MNIEARKPNKPLSHHELSVFCAQLSMLIKGGVAPYESVRILLSDTRDKEGQRILSDMMLVINTGEKLNVAMESTGVFPDYVIHMVQIGEESGRLDVVLDALAAFYDREDGLRETIRSALRYPLIMIGIMFLIVFVIITRVLPIFSQVFEQLGTGMNAFSESLLRLGERLNRDSIVIVVIVALVIAFALYLSHTRKGRATLSRVTQRLPFTASLHEDIAAGRFASGCALTLASGMDTYQSLDLVGKIVENEDVEQKIARCAVLIGEEGNTFPEALEETAIFTQLYTRMVKTGFKSGSLDATLRQIADHYERATDRKISGLISIVEPTLIIILSLIVGLILLSVILPLMGIMGTIG